MPVTDRVEYVLHCIFVKTVDRDDVEMAQEARRYAVPAAARGSHGCDHDDIDQLQDAGILPAGKQFLGGDKVDSNLQSMTECRQTCQTSSGGRSIDGGFQ